MLTENGRVVAVEPGWLWVETIRRSTCNSCSARQGCGHGILNRMSDGHRNFLKVSSDEFPEGRFKIDDEVRIAIPEKLLLESASLVYGLPLLCTLAGAVMASALQSTGGDSAAIAGAGFGFLAGFLLVRLHAWSRRNMTSLHPRLLGRSDTG